MDDKIHLPGIQLQPGEEFRPVDLMDVGLVFGVPGLFRLGEIVHSHQFPHTLFVQFLQHAAADESGSAGHYNVFHLLLCLSC